MVLKFSISQHLLKWFHNEICHIQIKIKMFKMHRIDKNTKIVF